MGLGSPANPAVPRAGMQRRHNALDQQILQGDAPADSSLGEAAQMCCCFIPEMNRLRGLVFNRLGGQQWQSVAFLSLKEEAFDCGKTVIHKKCVIFAITFSSTAMLEMLQCFTFKEERF